jgi:hypothetical protein
MPNYKKRKPYQTGGATKLKPLSKNETLQQRMQRMQIERNKKSTQPKKISQAQMDSMQRAAAQMKKERGLMELGNRQRAAAAKARARSGKGPTRAEAERNQAEYERAMRARQASRSRGSNPARPRTPTPQQRANYERMVREIQNRNRPQARPPSTSINRGRGIASPTIPTSRPQMRTPTPQELARLRANPNRPNMANQVQTLNQGNALERSRIQQQIAQLQARLRQLGG